MNKLVRLGALFLALLAFQSLSAQNNMEQGWKHFINNDLDKARSYFTKASTSSKDKADAFLALSLINQVDKPATTCFEDFTKFYEHAENPNPYLYALWYSESVTDGRGRLTKTQYAWLNDIIESGKLNSTMLAKAYSSLGYHFEELNNIKKADAQFSKIGAIMKWQLAGHFENISGSGFNKDYAPLATPGNGTDFENKNGAKVRWFSIPDNYRPAQWIYPSEHVYTYNSIVFAQTFVKSSKAQEVQFRLGVSGSVKVFVNDQLLFAEEEERDNGIDSYVFTANLNSGYNRIVLQLGQSDEVNNINYQFRITDKEGKLIPDIEAFDTPKPYDKEDAFTSVVSESFAEAYFENLYNEDKDNYLNYIMLARTYLANDKSYQARKVILEAQKKAPKCSYFSNMLMDVYIAEDSETLLSLELEKVKKNDPKNPLSLELLYNEAVDKEDWDEASKIVDDLEDVLGQTSGIDLKRISLLLQEEKTEEAFNMINSSFKKYPDNYSLLEYKVLIQLRVYKNTMAAIKLINTYLKRNYSENLEMTVAELYGEIGNVTKMVGIYNKLLKRTPYKVDYYGVLGQYNFSRQMYREAINYYNSVKEIAPYKSTAYSNLAQCYKELGSKDKAVSNFETSLVLNPNNYETRNLYRKYIDKKAVYDYFDEPDLYAKYKEAPEADDYPEDNSIILWDETQRVIYENGGSEEKHYLLVKVLNPSGIDSWKDYYIGVSSQSLNIEKAEVLKKDGNILKAETNQNQIVFTNLEEGDAILLIYKKENYQSGRLRKHFWDREYFHVYYPYANKKYSLLVQGDKKFQYKTANSDMEPVISSPDDEFKLYVWEREDVESLKDENYTPAIDDFTEVLHISSIPDWQFVNDWYYDISATKAKSDFEVQEIVKELMKGYENASDAEKAKRIYQYVVEEIRYSSISFRQSGIVPQKASKVINTKIGDCKDVATLFNAMCKEVGIKSDMVLVNTRNNGETEMTLPGIGFNHAISKIYLDGKEYFIELTSDYNAFATTGRSLKKSFILEINDQKSGAAPYLLNEKTRLPNTTERYSKVSFTDSKMLIRRDNVKYGTAAAGMRGSYRDIGDEKRKRKFQEAVSDDFAKAKMMDFGFDSTLYQPADSINYWYSFEVGNPFNMLGSIQLIELPFAWKQEPLDMLNTESREYPVALWKYSSMDMLKETLEIQIPEGKRLFEKPKNHNYTSDWGSYSLTFTQKGNTLFITRVMTFTETDVVKPEEFEKFSEYFGKIIKADQTQIGFK